MKLTADFTMLSVCFRVLIVGCAFGIWLPVRLGAQNLHLTTYQVDNGLSTDVVKAVHQDRYGFIWLATDEGLVRFDGRRSIVYNQALSSNFIKAFLHRADGKLLVVDDMGISEIISSPDTATFKILLKGGTRPTDTALHYPKSIYEDRKGRLWISENTRIVRYSNNNLEIYPFAIQDQSSDFLRSFSFCEDSYGRLWVVSFPGRLHYFNEDQNRFYPVQNIKPYGNTTAIIEARKGILWLGTLNGVYEVEISPDGKALSQRLIAPINGISFVAKSDKHSAYIGTWSQGLYHARWDEGAARITPMTSFPFSSINHIYHSRNGDIWVSTNEGLGLYQTTFFEGISIRGKRSFIQSIALSPDGQVYVANDGPLFRLIRHVQNSTFTDETIYKPDNGYVMCVSVGRQNIWIGTSAGTVVQKDLFSGQTKIKNVGNGKLIQSIEVDAQGNAWCSQDGFEGVLFLSREIDVKPYIYSKGISSQVNVIKTSPKGQLYCGADTKKGYLYRYDEKSDRFENLSVPIPFETRAEFGVNDLLFDPKTDGIWLGTTQGLILYQNGKLERVDFGPFYTKESVRALALTEDGSLWAAISFGLLRYKNGEYVLFDEASGLPAKTINYRSLFAENGKFLWAGTVKGAAVANAASRFTLQTPKPLFLSIRVNGNPVALQSSQIPIFPNGSFLETDVISMSFPTNRIFYQYRIKELNANWSTPDRNSRFTQHRLNYGRYTLEARAQQQGGYSWSEPAVFEFRVQAAWYESLWALLGAAVAMIGLAWGWAKINTLRLTAANKRFERIIQERTAEIRAKNAELEEQKIQLQHKNQKITDSIRYAQQIQETMMPDESLMADCFSDFFVLNRPKDIVSGDFYWVHKHENKVYFVVGDCTGHGVPAAMLAMAGSLLLKEIILEKDISEPVAVLNALNNEISRSFRQKSEDGIDMALCIIDTENGILTFAGAKSSVILIQGGEMTVLKGSRNYLGGVRKQDKRSFEAIHFEMGRGPLWLYAYSDGFQDQFGGQPRQKFTATRFKELIFNTCGKPMKEQRRLLLEELNRWMGQNEQIDDILVVGVKIG